MANDKKRRPTLKQDALVERLRPDPASPADARAFTGYLGRSVRDGYWRVYSSAMLDDYIEVAADDIIDTQPAAVDQPMAGTIVWIRRDARLEHTTVTSSDAQGEFLAGDISDELMRELGVQNLAGNTAEFRTIIRTFTRTVTRLICPSWRTGWCCPKTGLTACNSAPCCTSPGPL